jgi:restriction system protein
MGCAMPIPDYQTLMLPVLRSATKGEVRISDIIPQLADEFDLTPEEREILLPSGRITLFANRVHWAKTYLKQAGLIAQTRRSYFILTDRGLAALRNGVTRIDNRYLSQFPEFLEFKTRSKSEKPVLSLLEDQSPGHLAETPDELLGNAHKEIEAQLASALLDRILAAPPEFFERLVVNLLLAMGYGGSAKEAGQALGRSNDGGVDGVIDQDVLGLDRVYVQAKRYAPGNNVGASAIRDFFGSLDRFKAAKGLFVTTAGFTKDAEETAVFLSKRIVLIDGSRLAHLVIRYDVGCRVEETLELKKIDEDFFQTDQED